MSAYELPAWLDTRFIENALSRTAAPDKAELRDILDKSLALKSLTIQEATALMRVTDPEDVALMMKTADAVKQKAYGDRIVLTAPLHISNHCGSECLYCANRKSNTLIQRKYMTSPEMREAAGKLIRQGHKRIVLVSGQLPNADVEYLAEAISIMYTVFDGHGEVRRVNVNVGPLNADQYSVLLDADVGTVLIYQDTYHPDYYKAAHVAGPKSHYEKRLNAPEVALGAGVRDVGLGLLLGLAPWQFDVLALSLHAAHLASVYGTGGHTVSMHRMRPAPGGLTQAPFPVSDQDFLRCVAITRLAIPYTGIILSSREPSGLWRDGCGVGCSQLLTGSVANPYEDWSPLPGPGGVPFPIGENCHVDDVVSFLLEEARHLPSFCTACPRLGRSGVEFLSMVRECGMKGQCGPNSIASFLEFLLHYATPATRRLGEALIEEKLAAMPEPDKGAAVRLLRLPMYYGLTADDVSFVTEKVREFYGA